MPRPPNPLPASLPAVFTVGAAERAGVSRGRLQARDLEAPFRGVRVRVAPRPTASAIEADDVSPRAREGRRLRAEILARVAAYAPIMPAGAFFSHATAAVLWDLPLPLRVLRDTAREIDVAVHDARRGMKAAGVRGHQLRASMTPVRDRRGIRLTSPATTWALLGSLLGVDELVEVGDAIVHIPRARGMRRGVAEDALATPGQLGLALAAGRRIGADRLREALPLVRVGSASPGETRLRLALVRAGLPEPDLDVDVFAEDGTAIGFTELAYVRHRVLIEYEGDHHRTDRTQWDRDIDKHAACVDAGWDLVRITARHLLDRGGVAAARVRAALIRAGWRPGA